MPRTGLLAPALLAALSLAHPSGACAAADVAAEEAAYLRMALADDQLVESATRSPKPLSQIAENVTVVTSAEIEAMNAHTVAEVLDRVTGVFVQFFGRHLGAVSLPHIQGSGRATGTAVGDFHVLVLVDDVPWNSLSGAQVLETIPVGLVDRIEIIKGPASATWGSALGGVINVLTKKTGTSSVPAGALAASYGERDAFDGRAEAAGALGPSGHSGYYVQGQAQHANWDDAGASFHSRSLFAKTDFRPSDRLAVGLAGLYGRPEVDAGHLKTMFGFVQEERKSLLGRASLDARVGEGLSLHAVAYRLDQTQASDSQEDGLYPYPPDVPPVRAGDRFQDTTWKDTSQGAQGRLVWLAGAHTVVMGLDYQHGQEENTTESGAALQFFGLPASFQVTPSFDRWGAYANDTIRRGPLTVTPGLRFDRSSVGGSFASPSLGATCRLGQSSVVRLVVARGFTYPPLTALSGGGVDVDPNPDLEPERVWSYQAGLESSALAPFWLRATVFRHEVSGTLEPSRDSPGPRTFWIVNGGSAWRTGFEAEAETAALRGLSARGGFAYVRVERSGQEEEDEYQANLGLSYGLGSVRAGLFGHFVWWDLGRGSQEGLHDDFLWDLTASKAFPTPGNTETELFAAVHNLFDGDQTTDTNRGTEQRWVEAGVRLRF